MCQVTNRERQAFSLIPIEKKKEGGGTSRVTSHLLKGEGKQKEMEMGEIKNSLCFGGNLKWKRKRKSSHEATTEEKLQQDKNESKASLKDGGKYFEAKIGIIYL